MRCVHVCLALTPKTSNIMHEVAVLISSAVQKRLESGAGEWVPPESFNRKTTKYWVNPESIFPLKV